VQTDPDLVSRVGENVRPGSSSTPFDGRDGLGNALQERHRHHQGKYPSAKEIDILTMGRAPNNMLCSNNNDVDTIIQPYEDAAYDAVAAASGGFVVVGPKYYVPDCDTSYIFANDSDYTTTAANAIATQMAAYYVAHP
jgi:hypothetical protein